MGEHTLRIAFWGDQGGGKTSLAACTVDEFDRLGRTGRLVIVSPDPAVGRRGARNPLAERCGHVLVLTDDLAARGVDWPAAMADEPRLYVQLDTVRYPAACLGDLGEALRHAEDALVVFDEAYRTVPVQADERLLDLFVNGRKHGIDVITVSASAMQRNGAGISPLVWDQANMHVCFQITDENVRGKIAEKAPPIAAELPTLATPRDGGEPEYAVYFGGPPPRAAVHTRTGRRAL